MTERKNDYEARSSALSDKVSLDEAADMQAADARFSWALSTLRRQSRGFLQSDRFIDAMGLDMGERPSQHDRNASLDRVTSKLDRALKGLEKRLSSL